MLYYIILYYTILYYIIIIVYYYYNIYIYILYPFLNDSLPIGGRWKIVRELADSRNDVFKCLPIGSRYLSGPCDSNWGYLDFYQFRKAIPKRKYDPIWSNAISRRVVIGGWAVQKYWDILGEWIIYNIYIYTYIYWHGWDITQVAFNGSLCYFSIKENKRADPRGFPGMLCSDHPR